MSRDLHRRVRARGSIVLPGALLATRDASGWLGFTRLAPSGTPTPPAAIASVLGYAAEARRYGRRDDHAVYIDRVRQIRKRGTWR